MKSLAFSIVLIFSISGIFAENATNYGVVVYASGNDLGILRGTSYREFDPTKEKIIGFSVIEGDTIQTGSKTTVEIQLLPSKNILKISENTSVKLSNLSLSTGSLDVVYGRVRSKVNPLQGTDSFAIKGKSVVAGVRGTDFGVDVIAGSGSQNTKTTVYCFSGSVAVTTDDAKSTDPGVLLGANQMVTVSVKSGKAEKFDDKVEKFETEKFNMFLQKTIPKLVEEYWKQNPIESKEVVESELKENFPMAEKTAKEEAEIVSGKKEGDPLAKVEVITNIKPDAGEETLADSIPPLSEFNALELLPKNQYVYEVDGLKLAGVITGGVGIAATLTGIMFTYFGTTLGLDSASAQGLGIGLSIGGATLMLGGTTLFIIGFSGQ